MKKLITGIAMLGLCGLAALYMSSCAQQAGPLSPNLGLLSASSTGDHTYPTVSFGTPGSVSATATVTFSLPMNPATINTGTIVVTTIAADGLSEAAAAYVVTYNAASKQAIITPQGGVWVDNNTFHVEITTGCQTLTGNQIDSNGNGIPEAGIFDNDHYYFTFGVPTIAGYTPAYTDIQGSATWETNEDVAQTVNFGGTNGNVRCAYSYVTITVSLGTTVGITDPNFSFDASTFYVDPTTLSQNVSITDANGTLVTPVNVAVTTSVLTNDRLTIVLSLQPNTKYFMKMKGGLGGIRSSQDSSLYVFRGLYFDGDNDAYREAADDTEIATFMTADVDNSALSTNKRLYVTGSSYDGGLRRVTVNFSIPAGVGTGMLDPATVNTSTILLIDEDDTSTGSVNEPDKPVVPSSIELNQSNPGAPVVYLYVPLKFSQDSSDNHNHTVRVVVTPNVKTAEGIAMDQNNDGVQGNPDDVFSNTHTIVNIMY